MSVLNITNGDAAVNIIKQAGIVGENDEILPWRDVLHEGPVPFGLSLQEMTEVRVQFIADKNWGAFEETQTWFRYRDELLTSFKRFDKVVLWFEHDLYDQLQLIQILAWFATQDLENTNIHIICTENYLGALNATEMVALQAFETPLLYEQVVIATTAWQSFTLPHPQEWLNLLQQDTACLPFLEGAVLRLLQEYPDDRTGLTLTQFKSLQILKDEPMPIGRLFDQYLKTEERRFMGDSIFWEYIDQMLYTDIPLITLPKGMKRSLPGTPDQILTITQAGLSLLNDDDVTAFKTNDRWIGGVHLTLENQWVWNDKKGCIHN